MLFKAKVRAIALAAKVEARSGVGISCGVSFAALTTTLGIDDDKWQRWLGGLSTDYIDYIQLVLLASTLCLFGVALFRVGARSALPTGPVPRLSAERFQAKVLYTMEEAHKINSDLVHQVFQGHSLQYDRAMAAQQKNPRRLIGLMDKDNNKLAGWASIWPVTVEAGRAIERGKRLDDDLGPDDLLEIHRNKQAKYLILLSFCLLKEYHNSPGSPALRLARAVLDHIMYEFLGTPNRSVRLVAAAYSDEGERMCNRLGLEPTGHNAPYKDGPKPTFAGDVTIQDILAVCRRF